MPDLSQILADPEAEGPRRAYARAVEECDPDHAALIELQLSLDAVDPPRTPGERGRYLELSHQVAVLLEAHGRRLAGRVADLVDSYRFRRGFVEEITLTGEAFLSHGDALFAATPVRFLKLSSLPAGGLEDVLRPALSRLAGLDLADLEVGDMGAELLAGCPWLTGLRWLGLSGTGVRVAGARALATSPYLTKLAYVDSASNGVPLTPTPTVGPDWSITGWRLPGGLGLLRDAYGPRPWFEGVARTMHDHPPRWYHLIERRGR